MKLNPALSMTYAEKQERAAFKRKTLLVFLASGEVWTTLAMTAELLDITERTALRLLQSMVKDKLIKVDSGAGEPSITAPDTTIADQEKLKALSEVTSKLLNVTERSAVRILNKMVKTHQLTIEAGKATQSSLRLYGITAHGLAITDSAHPMCREYEIGSANRSYIEHHVWGQLVRIRGEKNGWTQWVPGRMLLVENNKRLKKLPDSLANRPLDGRRCAIENERFVKSYRRNVAIIEAHLTAFNKKTYDLVYYIVPDKEAQERAFARVKVVKIDGVKTEVTAAHRSRIKIFEIRSWKGEV